MTTIKNFGIIGGDKRQLYCGKSIADDGYGVYVCGFEKCDETLGLEQSDIQTVCEMCDAFIMPLPATRDGVTLNTPFSENKIFAEKDFFVYSSKKPVFAGMKNKLLYQSDCIYDYAAREEFAVANAVPTSEGAIVCAMREYEGTINGSHCLVTGYGRIGRVLSQMLRGLGADVTVSARQQKDLAYIRSFGMKAVRTSELPNGFDIIFNTVPDRILDAQTLAKTAGGSLVIDLASPPGGVDLVSAERLGIKAVQALSLPGRVAPKTAGIIIKNAVYNIIKEENL